MIEIVQAGSPEALDQVRALMRAFVAWHRERHVDDRALIDEYFDTASFERELSSLPGPYAPPDGSLLLAMHDGNAAGCVGMRALDHRHCEMKRMYVYPRFRGLGVGRALAREALEHARTRGYRTVRLDTSVRQTEAAALYRKLGFVETEPYYEMPRHIRDWLVFMELEL